MGQSSHRPPGLAGVVVVHVAVLGVLALLAAACAGGGERGVEQVGERSAEDGSAAAAEDRCDLGFNTASFNRTTELVEHVHDEHRPGEEVDFSLEEWAEVFVDEQLGMPINAVLNELHLDGIYRRHVLAGVLTHTLEPEPWIPMTRPEECSALARQLSVARAVALRYPTVADARAAGYVVGDSYYAGLGVHYHQWDYEATFDPSRPVELLYDGTDDDSALVGLSYVVSLPGEVPPEGFTGDNDRWHRHGTFCLDLNNGMVNLAADVLTEDECIELGGEHIVNDRLWMLHTWVVPGCESDWGVFSGANPSLPFLPPGVRLAPGCNSGKAVTDPLDLDAPGAGPGIS